MKRRAFLRTAGSFIAGATATSAAGVFGPAAVQILGDAKNSAQCFDVVDCKKSPYDLRPVNAAIVDLVRNNINPKKKTIILVGEQHETTNNALVETITVKACLDLFEPQKPNSPIVSVGRERDYSRLGKQLNSRQEDNLSRELITTMSKQDIHGDRALLTELAIGDNEQARQADEQQFFYFLDLIKQGKISHRFNDAAKKTIHYYTMNTEYGAEHHTSIGSYLDFTDPLNQKFLQTEWPCEPLEGIPCTSPAGIRARNHIQVENIINHMEETKTDCYVHSGGLHHIFGNQNLNDPYHVLNRDNQELPYQDSLHHLLEQKHYNVLVVLPSMDHDNFMIPEDAWKRLNWKTENTGHAAGLKIKNSDDRTFNVYEGVTYDAPEEEQKNGIRRNLQRETSVIEKFVEHSGGVLPYHSVGIENLNKELAEKSPQWIAQAQAAL